MIRSLLDADEFRPFTEQEQMTFDALIQTEDNLKVGGLDLKTMGVPAQVLDALIRENWSNEVADMFHVQVMTKRLALTPPFARYSAFTLLFLATSADRVGVAVMWSYTMLDYYRRHREVMTLEALKATFNGQLPTEDVMHRIWEEQKQPASENPSDNQIDNREVWQF